MQNPEGKASAGIKTLNCEKTYGNIEQILKPQTWDMGTYTSEDTYKVDTGRMQRCEAAWDCFRAAGTLSRAYVESIAWTVSDNDLVLSG